MLMKASAAADTSFYQFSSLSIRITVMIEMKVKRSKLNMCQFIRQTLGFLFVSFLTDLANFAAEIVIISATDEPKIAGYKYVIAI